MLTFTKSVALVSNTNMEMSDGVVILHVRLRCRPRIMMRGNCSSPHTLKDPCSYTTATYFSRYKRIHSPKPMPPAETQQVPESPEFPAQRSHTCCQASGAKYWVLGWVRPRALWHMGNGQPKTFSLGTHTHMPRGVHSTSEIGGRWEEKKLATGSEVRDRCPHYCSQVKLSDKSKVCKLNLAFQIIVELDFSIRWIEYF